MFPTQPKLPDTIIWLQQKMPMNYGILPAQVMKSSHDSIIILPLMRTAEKLAHDSIIILPLMRTAEKLAHDSIRILPIMRTARNLTNVS